MVEAVDLPVAMLPVRAMRSMVLVGLLWWSGDEGSRWWGACGDGGTRGWPR